MKQAIKRILSVLTVFSILFTLVAPAWAAGNQIKCYTISAANTKVYKDAALSEEYGTIYPTDELEVKVIAAKYVKVQYPIKNGTKLGYIPRSAILLNTSGKTYKAKDKIVTYRRASTANTYGEIAVNDKVTVFGTKGNFTQVRYPVSWGYKIAFIKSADARKALYGDSSTLSISGQSIPKSINEGSGFTCKGTIKSNYNITKVVVRIVDSRGIVVTSATRTPNSKSYNIIDLDSDVHFSYAKAGTNRYQIYAADVKGEKCLVDVAFEVKEDTVKNTVYGSPQKGSYNGKEFYVFSQLDEQWANEPYKKGTINGVYQDATVGTSGCHLLSLVNATHWLSGKFIDPIWLARYAIQEGYRTNGNIDMEGLYQDISKNYGLTYGVKYVGFTQGSKRFTNLKKHLQDGDVAIGGGMKHVMAVVAYDRTTEKYLVLDSYGCKSRGTSKCWYIWKSESQMTGKFGFTYFYFIGKQ